MRIDVELFAGSPAEAGDLASKAEEFGFDCVWVNETKHDPFLQLAVAASRTKSIMLGTSIALAFTRSPTTLAYTAWDLQNFSRGRLLLGLGSQVKGHIERRFGMKWESPAPKMREVILALRSVWKSWQTGERLEFQGKYFKLDLMTSFFSPGPIGSPAIPIYVAGVNEGMCRVAGRFAEGLHVHPLHTVRYLKETALPAVAVGLEGAGRERKDFQVAASVFAAPGDDEDQIASVKRFYRNQIAFYASTRTYRKVMEIHGWGGLCDRLHRLSVEGKWEKMADQVGDDVLREFVVEGDWKEIGKKVVDKYEGLVDRVRFYVPFDGSAGWRGLAEAFPGH